MRKENRTKNSISSSNACTMRSNKNNVGTIVSLGERTIRSNVAYISLDNRSTTRSEKAIANLDIGPLRCEKCITSSHDCPTSTHSGIPSKHMRTVSPVDSSNKFLADVVIRETCRGAKKQGKYSCCFHVNKSLPKNGSCQP